MAVTALVYTLVVFVMAGARAVVTDDEWETVEVTDDGTVDLTTGEGVIHVSGFDTGTTTD